MWPFNQKVDEKTPEIPLLDPHPDETISKTVVTRTYCIIFDNDTERVLHNVQRSKIHGHWRFKSVTDMHLSHKKPEWCIDREEIARYKRDNVVGIETVEKKTRTYEAEVSYHIVTNWSAQDEFDSSYVWYNIKTAPELANIDQERLSQHD